MILDVDVGNSRVKWRITRDSGVVGQGIHKTFSEAVDEICSLGVPERIRLANVANDRVTQEIEVAASRWGCKLQKAFVMKKAGGVTCGYEHPDTLGVDRWLALIAAWQHYRHACVVVDAGSAATIDVLDGKGVHQGGYIVPGVMMMRNSLLSGTAKVHVSEEIEPDLSPGVSTQEAVDHGVLLMLRAFIETVHTEVLTEEKQAKIIVTGGDGDLLLPLICKEAILYRDLVMDGLAVVFP